MSNSNSSVSSGGIGCVGALTLLFIGLKLAEIGVVATWSWWWVLSPVWISWGIVLAIIVGVFAIAFLGEWLKK